MRLLWKLNLALCVVITIYFGTMNVIGWCTPYKFSFVHDTCPEWNKGADVHYSVQDVIDLTNAACDDSDSLCYQAIRSLEAAWIEKVRNDSAIVLYYSIAECPKCGYGGLMTTMLEEALEEVPHD